MKKQTNLKGKIIVIQKEEKKENGEL